jgi:hypothetical protein
MPAVYMSLRTPPPDAQVSSRRNVTGAKKLASVENYNVRTSDGSNTDLDAAAGYRGKALDFCMRKLDSGGFLRRDNDYNEKKRSGGWGVEGLICPCIY